MAELRGGAKDKGHWTQDDLGATVRQTIGDLPDRLDTESELDRAARSIARALRRRAKSAEFASDPALPIVVLVDATWRAVGEKNGWSFEAAIDDGSTRLAGRLLITPANVSAAYSRELPSPDLGDTFSYIENSLQLGDMVALVVNPGATLPELRVYPRGVARVESIVRHPLYFGDLDLQSLDGELDRFHDQVVCAPGGTRKCKRLWSVPNKYKPVTRPEKTIQDELVRFLRVAFPYLYVTEEDDTKLGRLDVRLTGSTGIDDFSIVHHAVIELKALHGGSPKPPFKDSKKVRDQVHEGVVQVCAYVQPPTPARIAILGCYDMRAGAGKRGNSCFNHVLSVCKSNGIALRRWPLFPTTRELRNYKMGKLADASAS